MQNREKGLDEFAKNACAPVEHLFDNHQFCDPAWCWTKDIDDKCHRILISHLETNVSVKLS